MPVTLVQRWQQARFEPPISYLDVVAKTNDFGLPLIISVNEQAQSPRVIATQAVQAIAVVVKLLICYYRVHVSDTGRSLVVLHYAVCYGQLLAFQAIRITAFFARFWKCGKPTNEPSSCRSA
jgi:hypothetical protein